MTSQRERPEPSEATSRADAISRAAKLVDELDDELVKRGAALVAAEPSPLSVARVCRNHLCQVVADHLQAQDLTAGPVPHSLYAGAQLVRAAFRSRLSGRAGLPTRPTILAVPRMSNHLRDQLRVAAALRFRHGIDVAFLLFRRDHLELVQAAGLRSFGADEHASGAASLLVRWRWELARERANGLRNPALGVLSTGLLETALASVAIRRCAAILRPMAMLVGNPCTLEGRIAAGIAREASIPSAAIQHGDILSGDPLWRRVNLDRFLVWGDRSRRSMTDSGFPPDRVVVTGAPWTDAITHGTPPPGRHRVLVAVSGAGHQVGLAEHLATVERIVAAAESTSSVAWRVRLHPKDDSRIWLRAIQRVGSANIEVRESKTSSTTIHDDLAESSLLVTVASTAGLDAMLAGRPVISLDRTAPDEPPDFAEHGASIRVGQNEQLAATVMRTLTSGAPSDVLHAASRYAATFFGPMNQGATNRAADAIASMIDGRHDP